jgi:hypothetical protein
MIAALLLPLALWCSLNTNSAIMSVQRMLVQLLKVWRSVAMCNTAAVNNAVASLHWMLLRAPSALIATASAASDATVSQYHCGLLLDLQCCYKY